MVSFKNLHDVIKEVIENRLAAPKAILTERKKQVITTDLGKLVKDATLRAKITEFLSLEFTGTITKAELHEISSTINSSIIGLKSELTEQEIADGKKIIQAINGKLINRELTPPHAFLSTGLETYSIAPEQQAEILALFTAFNIESEPYYGDDPNIIAMARTYAGKFDPNEYKKLLLYFQAAYIFEQNGTPQDHALRLAITFGSAKMALKYITLYKTSTKELKDGKIIDHSDDQFVHDACLFTLPDVDINWQYWRRIISPDIFVQKHIRNLFASARDIEDFIVSLKKPILEVKDKKKIEEELARTIIEYNRLKKHRGLLNRTDKEKCDLLATKIISLHIALSSAYGGVKLEDTPLKALISHYERYKTEASESYNFFLSNGLSAKHHLKFLELDRTKAGANIPNIGVISLPPHPQYKMRKLIIQNKSDAAIAACLGKLTSCCQSLSGEAGEPCAIHGLTSPNGGFYVVFDERNRVVAQSWVWRGTKDELVFDSVEKLGIDDKVVKELYTEAAKLLAEHFKVESILVGTSGQTPPGVGRDISLSACPKDYFGYRDSHKQRAFTHALAPYLLLDYVVSPKIQNSATKMLIDALTNLEDPNNIKFITILLQILTTMPCNTIELAMTKLRTYFNLEDLNPELFAKLRDKLNATRLLVDAISSETPPPNIAEVIVVQIQRGASVDLRWVGTYIKDKHKILSELFATILESQLPNLIETPSDFYNVLDYLTIEQKSILYRGVREKIIPQINTLGDLHLFSSRLNSQEKAEVLDRFKENICELIKSYIDLYQIFDVFNLEYLTENSDRIRSIIQSLIRSAKQFKEIISSGLKKEQIQIMFRLIGVEALLAMIGNSDDLEKIIKLLPLEQCRLIFAKLRPNLPMILSDINDLMRLARNHDSDYSKNIGELFGLDFIESLVKCPEDLYKISVEAKFTEEERQNLYDIIRPRLISMIKTTDDLYYAFEVSREDQQTAIFEKSIPNLSNLSIVNTNILNRLFQNLTADQQTVLFVAVKDELIAKLKKEVDILEITRVLNALNDEQYKIIQDALDLSIKGKNYTIKDLLFYIGMFRDDPRKIKILLDLIAKHILTFIATKKDFADILNEIVHITDNQQILSFLLNQFATITKDKLISLITSINDFEDLIRSLRTTGYELKSNLKIKLIFGLSCEKLLTLIKSQNDLYKILNLADQANLPIDELTSVCRALYLVASKTSSKLDDVQIFLAKLLSLNALKSTGLPYVTTIFLPRILAVEKTTIDSSSQTTEDSEPEGTVKTVVSLLRETKADRTKGESSCTTSIKLD